MQSVTFTKASKKKKRTIQVLVGWNLVRPGRIIRKEDLYLNTDTGSWQHVTEEHIGSHTTRIDAVIRLQRLSDSSVFTDERLVLDLTNM